MIISIVLLTCETRLDDFCKFIEILNKLKFLLTSITNVGMNNIIKIMKHEDFRLRNMDIFLGVLIRENKHLINHENFFTSGVFFLSFWLA